MHLMLTRAYCKILLSLSDLRQAWISIHSDQIASQTCEKIITDLPLRPFACLDQFVARYKMIVNDIACCFTRNFRPFDGSFKFTPTFIPQQRHQLTCLPILYMVGIEVLN